MKKFENITLADRVGTWYEIERTENFILFESEVYGDEAGWILTDKELHEICETWDDIETTVSDLGL